MSVGPSRRLLFAALSRIHGGRVEITEGRRRFGFGPVDAALRARIEVRDPRAYRWSLRGSTGLGEGYVEGLWSTDDLVAVARIACRNLPPLDRWRRRIHPLFGPVQRALTRVPRNTRKGAAANISAHYDLGNSLFEGFLDPRLMYSCAYYPDDETSLEDAQLAKLERICERLRLGPDDHLLEIGTGWGGLAIHAATTRGCRVTTTTISREQHEYALARVRQQGLTDRVEVLLRDYRDLEGSYDKLASIEMIEAVGWQYFPEFFARCAALTRPEGGMFLQAIVIEDHLYEPEKAARSFANKHIFPGGCLPSLGLIKQLGAANGMATRWCDEISAHYARTLASWRKRFNDARPALRPLGYDERFQRLWNFYLASSEGGFRERRIRNVQMVLAKPGWQEGASEWSSTYERRGAGEPLVLIHGLGGSMAGLEPGARPTRRGARRDRGRPARRRRLGRARREHQAYAGQPRRRRLGLLRSARARAAARRRQLAGRLDRARDGQGRPRGVGVRDLAGGPVVAAARPAAVRLAPARAAAAPPAAGSAREETGSRSVAVLDARSSRPNLEGRGQGADRGLARCAWI